MKQIIASDLNTGEECVICFLCTTHEGFETNGPILLLEFWEFGHVLCRSTPESFPVTFLAGDALDPEFLSPILYEVETRPPLDLARNRTLNALKGKCSVIYARSFFHVRSSNNSLGSKV